MSSDLLVGAVITFGFLALCLKGADDYNDRWRRRRALFRRLKANEPELLAAHRARVQEMIKVVHEDTPF